MTPEEEEELKQRQLKELRDKEAAKKGKLTILGIIGGLVLGLIGVWILAFGNVCELVLYVILIIILVLIVWKKK